MFVCVRAASVTSELVKGLTAEEEEAEVSSEDAPRTTS
jgi:hypothetical protein